MMSPGWAWLGPSDVLRSEEAVISGEQRIEDARRALSGWLFVQNEQKFPQGFIEAVKAKTAADFDISNEMDIGSNSMSLYDVRIMDLRLMRIACRL